MSSKRRRRPSRPRAATAASLIAIILSGCASSTLIRTSPPGVTVYADGSRLGTAPAVYSDTKITGSTTRIDLKKDGCEPRTVLLTRNEEANAGAIVGGVLCLFPFLWTLGYRAEHHYEMECGPVDAAFSTSAVSE